MKNHIMTRMTIIALTLLLSCPAVHAQVSEKLKSASWVRIMHGDTGMNYFTAKRDFAAFMAEHRKNEDSQETKEKKPEHVNTAPPREAHLESPEEALIVEYKRWARSIKPFVKSDGRIRPVEERIKAVNRGNSPEK